MKPHFYMKRIVLLADGTESEEEEYDLEEHFPGLRYKSLSGIEGYGTPRTYTETVAESDEANVYVPATDTREQTDITLTLYFFDGNNNKEQEDIIASIDATYHSFMEYLSSAKIIYRDNVRKRKAKMYLSSSTTPKTDSLKGLIYKEVEFKFKNIYGRSFPIDSTIF